MPPELLTADRDPAYDPDDNICPFPEITGGFSAVDWCDDEDIFDYDCGDAPAEED